MRRPIRLALTVSVAASAIGGGTALLTAGGASAASFAGGDVVVYQVGDGSTTLSNKAAPVFLKEYGPSGTAVQSIPLPTADTSGGQHALTATGLSTSEGEITRSPDGRYLTVTGYDATVVAGEITYCDGVATDLLPGRLIKSAPLSKPR